MRTLTTPALFAPARLGPARLGAARLGAVLFAAALGLAACEGENLFSGISAVANQSEAYDAVTFRFESEAGDTLDVIARGGRFELILDRPNGEFDSRFQFRAANIRADGTFVIRDDDIIFSRDPFAESGSSFERSLSYSEVADAILLEDRAALFDINNDGRRQSARLRIRLEPRR